MFGEHRGSGCTPSVDRNTAMEAPGGGNAQQSPEGCTGAGPVKKQLKESRYSPYSILSVVKLLQIKQLVNENHFVDIYYTTIHTWNFTLSPIILISNIYSFQIGRDGD